MKKVGIIRCQQTEDMCPGTTDFVTAGKGKGSFEALGECQIVGFVSCGGCPGKRAVGRAKMLVDRGAEAVALASCIGKGTPIGFPCPNKEQMAQAIRAKIGDVPLLGSALIKMPSAKSRLFPKGKAQGKKGGEGVAALRRDAIFLLQRRHLGKSGFAAGGLMRAEPRLYPLSVSFRRRLQPRRDVPRFSWKQGPAFRSRFLINGKRRAKKPAVFLPQRHFMMEPFPKAPERRTSGGFRISGGGIR